MTTKETRHGHKVLAHCGSCDNALLLGNDYDPATMTEADYLLASVEANQWASPVVCDRCAHKAEADEPLPESHTVSLRSLKHYWDPQGPVRQRVGDDGALRLRELSLDDIAAVIADYDRRLCQLLDKVAFEAREGLVDYRPVALRNLPEHEAEARVRLLRHIHQRATRQAEWAERDATRQVLLRTTRLVMHELTSQQVDAEQREQLRALARSFGPGLADVVAQHLPDPQVSQVPAATKAHDNWQLVAAKAQDDLQLGTMVFNHTGTQKELAE